MTEIKKEAVEFPVLCHLVAGEFTLVGITLFFNFLHCSAVKRKLYNLADMLGCLAIGFTSNEQMVME